MRALTPKCPEASVCPNPQLPIAVPAQLPTSGLRVCFSMDTRGWRNSKPLQKATEVASQHGGGGTLPYGSQDGSAFTHSTHFGSL